MMDIIKSTKLTTLWRVSLFLLCTTQHVMSQPQTVLSVEVKEQNEKMVFNFSMDILKRFYDCLCSSNNICVALFNPKVGNVASCSIANSGSVEYNFICQRHNDNILCERRAASQDLQLKCRTDKQFLSTGNTKCSKVLFRWVSGEDVKISYFSPSITCNVESNGTYNLYLPHTESPLDSLTARPATGVSAYTVSGVSQKKGHDEIEISTIIGTTVGVALVAVILAIIVIILWRRKNESTPSSLRATNNNNNIDDNTDIYPYGDSTLSNIAPNLNSSSNDSTTDVYATVDPRKKLNKTRTLSGIKVNNVYNDSSNTSMQTHRPQSPRSDYTETKFDLDADHYQGIKDVHAGAEDRNVLGLSLAPSPDSSTKSKYYNGDSKAVKSSDQANCQNQMRSESTVNEGQNNGYELAKPILNTQYTPVNATTKTESKLAAEGLYPSAHENDDPYFMAAPYTPVTPSTNIKSEPASRKVCSSGYEDVYPNDNNRYTSVDVSAKTNSKPASKDVHSDDYEDAKPHHHNGNMTVELFAENGHTLPLAFGVYSKLHGPVRNVTNAYNEWSVSDEAEKL